MTKAGKMIRAGWIALATSLFVPQMAGAQSASPDAIGKQLIPQAINDGIKFALTGQCGSARLKLRGALDMLPLAHMSIAVGQPHSPVEKKAQTGVMTLLGDIEHCDVLSGANYLPFCIAKAEMVGRKGDADYINVCYTGLKRGFDDLPLRSGRPASPAP
jgi:hypothetical protein